MPGNPITDPIWAANLADMIERYVTTVRDKATRPILIALRLVIFGIVAAIGAIVAIVLLTIALIRALQALLELGVDHTDAVWISYLLLGVIFSVTGLVVLHKRFGSATATTVESTT